MMDCGFRMELALVRECATCGQNIRAEQALPSTCLPRDPLTRQVRHDFLVCVLGYCPACFMSLESLADALGILKRWAARGGVTEGARPSAERCPPGSAGLPWDWMSEGGR